MLASLAAPQREVRSRSRLPQPARRDIVRINNSLALWVAACFLGGLNVASAQCPAPPYQLTNGQTADATQVMANFNQIVGCLNSGQLTVPPVSSLGVTGPGGGTVAIQNPAASTSYSFNLPVGPGTPGQLLASNGGSSPMYWATAPSLNPPPLIDGIPVGRPAAASFLWFNQGSASYAEYTNGPITLSIPAQGSDQLRGIGQAPPSSTPYTLTAKIDTLLWGGNYYLGGIYVLDSGGKLLALNYQTQSGSQTAHTLAVERWNSVSSINTTVKSAPISDARVWWFRVNNDGTNWNFYVSHDGVDWINFYSEPLGAFLGPTISTLGVFGDNNDTTAIGLGSFISIWSYELVTGSGTNSSWQ
jgi:hypothetical protein